MHAHPRNRRALVIVVALALCVGSTAAVATAKSSSLHLGGKWTGSYSGSYAGTFTINWTQTGSKLKGTIHLSNPNGIYGINGSVTGDAIQFGAVTAGATYTGTVSASSTAMGGKYVTANGGHGTWGAKKYVPKKVVKKS
jgi:hypothetical protein